MMKIGFWNRLAIQGVIVFLVWVVLYEYTYFENDWLLLAAVAAGGQLIKEVVGVFRNFRIEKKK